VCFGFLVPLHEPGSELVIQLDPTTHKTVLDIQQEAHAADQLSKKSKGKQKEKAAADEMDVDEEDMDSENDVEVGDDDEEGVGGSFVPMPTSGGIQDLREKLHAKMASLRRGGNRAGGYFESTKDDLLEERRAARAAMRERRRKETKEKIRRQAEERGKKGKGKDKDKETKGGTTKVWHYCDLILRYSFYLLF